MWSMEIPILKRPNLGLCIMVVGEAMQETDSEICLPITDHRHPLDDIQQEGNDIDIRLQGKADRFNVELSNLSMVRGKGGSVMLRFNLSWFYRDETHGWLGDTSTGCLAFRDRDNEVHWANHKLSFGGPFSKSVHSPTKGYYNLVLGIITGSKFKDILKPSDPWGKEARAEERKRAKDAGEVGTLEKVEGVLDGQQESH